MGCPTASLAALSHDGILKMFAAVLGKVDSDMSWDPAAVSTQMSSKNLSRCMRTLDLSHLMPNNLEQIASNKSIRTKALRALECVIEKAEIKIGKDTLAASFRAKPSGPAAARKSVGSRRMTQVADAHARAENDKENADSLADPSAGGSNIGRTPVKAAATPVKESHAAISNNTNTAAKSASKGTLASSRGPRQRNLEELALVDPQEAQAFQARGRIARTPVAPGRLGQSRIESATGEKPATAADPPQTTVAPTVAAAALAPSQRPMAGTEKDLSRSALLGKAAVNVPAEFADPTAAQSPHPLPRARRLGNERLPRTPIPTKAQQLSAKKLQDDDDERFPDDPLVLTDTHSENVEGECDGTASTMTATASAIARQPPSLMASQPALVVAVSNNALPEATGKAVAAAAPRPVPARRQGTERLLRTPMPPRLPSVPGDAVSPAAARVASTSADAPAESPSLLAPPMQTAASFVSPTLSARKRSMFNPTGSGFLQLFREREMTKQLTEDLVQLQKVLRATKEQEELLVFQTSKVMDEIQSTKVDHGLAMQTLGKFGYRPSDLALSVDGNSGSSHIPQVKARLEKELEQTTHKRETLRQTMARNGEDIESRYLDLVGQVNRRKFELQLLQKQKDSISEPANIAAEECAARRLALVAQSQNDIQTMQEQLLLARQKHSMLSEQIDAAEAGQRSTGLWRRKRDRSETRDPNHGGPADADDADNSETVDKQEIVHLSKRLRVHVERTSTLRQTRHLLQLLLC